MKHFTIEQHSDSMHAIDYNALCSGGQQDQVQWIDVTTMTNVTIQNHEVAPCIRGNGSTANILAAMI